MSNIQNYQDVGFKGSPVWLCRAAMEYIERFDPKAKIYLVAPHMDLAERMRDDGQCMSGANAVAVLLDAGWSDGAINARAEKTAALAKEHGKRVALVGVPRKRLSPAAQALADWVII